MTKRKHVRRWASENRGANLRPRRTYFESLEDRRVLTWVAAPPATIAVPKVFTAVKLNASSSATGNAAISNSEIDYYSFTAGISGNYVVSATTPSSNLNSVLGVFSATGARLKYINDISSSNFDSRLAISLIAGTHYFVGITNNSGSPQGSYTWTINGPGTAFPDDPEEKVTGGLLNGQTVNSTNNNSVVFGFSNGQPIINTDLAYNLGILNTAKTLSNLALVDGDDWYKFTITSTGTATESVSIAFQQLQGDLELELWSLAGSAISPSKPIKPIATSTGIGNSESIPLLGLAAGTYYVHVYGYLGTINPSYNLTVTLPVIPTWQKIAATNAKTGPTSIQAMVLLSDGSVLAQGGNGVASTAWYKLTPDAAGNFSDGTWTVLAPDPVARLGASTDVLQNGDVLIYGGADADMTDPAATEIYDAVANTWTQVGDFPETFIGQNPSEVLPDGTVLAGSATTNATYLFDPATGTWSPTAGSMEFTGAPSAGGSTTSPVYPFVQSGDSWMKLANGDVLSYDAVVGGSDNFLVAEIYDPTTQTWTDASTLSTIKPAAPLATFNQLGFVGPAFLLPNGQAFMFGADGATAYFDPTANSGAGAWTAGPAEPERLINTITTPLVATGNPGVVLPNGDILITLSPEGTVNYTFDPMTFDLTGAKYTSPPPTFLYELNTTTKVFTDVTPTSLPIANANRFNMVDLPTGQVLIGGPGTLQIYTPTVSTIQNSLRPVVQSVVDNMDGTFTVTGLQLTGMSDGSSSGDITANASNYPIVRLTNVVTGLVYYARSFNWSSSGVQTGATTETADFTLPSGMPAGTYNLVVVANGIASNPFEFDQAVAVAVVINPLAHSNASSGSVTMMNSSPGVSSTIITGTLNLSTAPVGATSGSITLSGSLTHTVATTSTATAVSSSSLKPALIDALMPHWGTV
ncbi:MAG TPA: kelch repeat-containing protein [Pirellulales bacterium]|jgi:hypothetical protein|nr:kelch repeat-containing protein [Pirellulales bacterium]